MDVLYLDNHLLLVNKPPGMLVQEDKTGDLDLLSIGKAYLKEVYGKPGDVYLGLVHRLDRPASGVMVFARTSKAAARLSEQFRLRTVEKYYMAIVEGCLEGAGIALDRLVSKGGFTRVAGDEATAGRAAELQWHAISFEDEATLIDVRLKTGRKHQIRVQLSEMGHPILGDFRYGATRPLDGKNLALHCYRLGFHHPTTKERLVFKVAPPWRERFEREIREMIARDS